MASLGSLVVSLAMDTAAFSGSVGKAAREMERLTIEAGKIGAAIGANIGIGLKVIGSLVVASVDAADATSKLSESLGVSIQDLSQLGYAAELANVSQEELGKGLVKLAKFAVDAASGGKTASETFAAMGVNVKNGDGSLKSTRDLLGDVADKFSTYKSGAERTALATEIFGKAGARLIPFLTQGRAGLEALAKEADMLGLTLTEGAGRAAEQFNDNLTRLKKAKEGLGLQIAQKLLPTLEALTNKLFDSASSSNSFGKAAEVAAMGVKLLLASGALLVGVFKTVGEYLGGIGAAAVALFSGRFKEAYEISKSVGSDLASNIKDTVGNVVGIFDTTAAKIDAGADSNSGKIAAPMVLAAEKVGRAARVVKSEAEKMREAIEKRLASMQFDVDTQGASDRIKGLIELTRQGASPEMTARYLALSDAQAAYRTQTEAAAKAQQEQNAVMMEGVSVTQSLRDPTQIVADEYAKMDRLLQAGAINFETYVRGLRKASDAFNEAQPVIEKTTTLAEEFAVRARDSIQRSLGDSLVSVMDGNFKNIGQQFTKLLQRMVAEAIAANITQSLFGSVGGKGSSAAGIGGPLGPVLNGIGNFLFGGKAYGGPVSAGIPQMTGEHGPEVFIPSTAGTVVPSSGLGSTNYISVSMTAVAGMSRQTALQQGQDIGLGIQRALARNG